MLLSKQIETARSYLYPYLYYSLILILPVFLSFKKYQS